MYLQLHFRLKYY